MTDCGQCGKSINSRWPALAAMRPDTYVELVGKIPPECIQSDDDRCIIKVHNEASYFIRCVCEQKIKGSNLHYEYGPWLMVDEETFKEYVVGMDEKITSPLGVGIWNTNIPWYPNMHGIPCKIYLQGKGLRPIVEPVPEIHHPFILDYYNGIREEEAERRHQLFMTLSGR